MRFITKKHLSRRAVLRRHGRHGGAAFPRFDVARANNRGEDGRREDARRIRVCSAWRGDGPVDSRRRRRCVQIFTEF